MHIREILSCRRLGAGAVTGIGSLPHTDAEAAVRLVAEVSPEIPFWPQLPQRAVEERMVEQALTPVLDLLAPRRDSCGYALLRADRRADLIARFEQAQAALAPFAAAGFFAFERALADGAFPRAVVLKGQIIGPATLAALLFVDGLPLVNDPVALAVVGSYIQRLAIWQIERLARWRTPVLLMLDEPYLALLPERDATGETMRVVQSVVHGIQATGALVGVHCCAILPDGAPPVALLCRTGADVVSFDAYHRVASWCAAPEVCAFLARGGVLAFGLVPTLHDLSALCSADLLTNWIIATAGCDRQVDVASHTLVTATCGLGLLSEDAARQSFRLARDVAGLIGRMPGLEAHGQGERSPR
jgi:glutathione S-transferase